MPYSKVKIYSDGSHFIGIPPKPSTAKRRKKPVDELIEVKTEKDVNVKERPPDMPDLNDTGQVLTNIGDLTQNENSENVNCPTDMPDLSQNNVETRVIGMKEYFEELYKKYGDCKKREKRNNIISDMREHFDTYEQTAEFVDKNIERKTRNLICRRVRLSRKINLQKAGDGFNYFCTFTYDDKKHTEDSFKKGLKSTLQHFSSRKGWRYIGVWERGEDTKRLHFHALLYVPEGTMSGEIIEVKDYDTRSNRMRITHQNTFFNSKFGRSDFDAIETSRDTSYAVSYITKYIEKTGEKIVYSRGLYQYIVSDVMDDDIICDYDLGGNEGNKFILNDKFTCWDEGEKIGEVSPETIARMPKSN